MVNSVKLGNDLISYLDSLGKKGKNRDMLELIAKYHGGKHSILNENELKKSNLKKVIWSAGTALMLGIGTYNIQDLFFYDFKFIEGVSSLMACLGGYGMYKNYSDLIKNSNEKAIKGLEDYLKKDL